MFPRTVHLVLCIIGLVAIASFFSGHDIASRACGGSRNEGIAFHALDDEDDGNPHPSKPGHRRPVPSLYHEPYSSQTFLGTHDCFAIRNSSNNWSLSGNQYYNVSVQLESGVRFLQAQGHLSRDNPSEIRLCHFNCALMDGGSLDSHLATIKTFLDAHPTEILTLLFVNAAGQNSLPLWAAAFHRAGLDIMSFIPSPDLWFGKMGVADWPSPAQMVAANQRLVTFLSSGASQPIVPYLLPEWDYVFETSFGNESPSQFSCAPARPWHPPPPSGGLDIPDKLALVNHFLYAKFFGFRYPNASYAGHTNAAGLEVGMLGEHAVRCFDMYGRRPNFVLVDFWNEGDVWAVEEGLNAN